MRRNDGRDLRLNWLQELYGYIVKSLNRQSYIVTGLKELDSYMVTVRARCNDVTFLTL
jgi:hypothetical protein